MRTLHSTSGRRCANRRNNGNARFLGAIERIEPRVLLSAGTYTGAPAPIDYIRDAATSSAYTTSTSGTASAFFAVGGSAVGSIAQAFGVMDFSPSTSPSIFPAAGHTVNSLSNLSLSLYNTASSGNFGGASGTFNVWLADPTANIDPPGSTVTMRFNQSDVPNGLDPSLNVDENMAHNANFGFLGTFAFDHTSVSMQSSTLSSFMPATATTLVSDLNTYQKFRLVISPASTTVAADWAGVVPATSSNFSHNPSLSVNVDETVVQSVTLSSSTYSVPEDVGTGNVTITVNRNPGPGGDLSGSASVNYATANGTALAGTNYTAQSGTLNWGPGDNTPQTFTVPIADVQPQGGDKTFTVTLSNPTGVVLGPPSTSTSTVTIQDDNEKFALSSAGYNVNESAGTAYMSITRTGYLGDAATVNYAPSDGTGLAGTNYTATSGSVSFAVGQSVATFAVPILAANPQNGNKTFTVTLSNPLDTAPGNEGVSLGQTTTTVTIVDTAPLTNNLSSLSPAVTEITPTSALSGGSSGFAQVTGGPLGSFTTAAFEIFTFSKANNPSIYPAVGFTVNSLSNLSLQLYNTANGAAGTGFNGQPGNFNVYFIPNTETTSPTTSFRFQSADVNGLNGQGGTSSATLIGTFSFNQPLLGYDTFSQTSLQSAVSSGLITALNSGTNFRIAVTPQTTGMGADWDATHSGHTPVLSFTASQTQTSSVDTFGFNASNYSVNETDGTATITVTRSFSSVGGGVQDAASVHYATSDATALAGTNYTASSGTLNFAAGDVSKTFTVPITAVNPQGGNKFLNLTLSSPAATGSNTVAALGQSTATLTVVDTTTGGAATDLTSWSNHNAYVRPSGPIANSSFLDVLGSSNGSTEAFGILDFNVQNGDGFQFAPTNPVNAINSITLGLVNTPFSGSSSGLLDVYMVSDASRSLTDATLTYGTGPEGLQAQLGTKTLLGQINYHVTDPTSSYSLYTLSNFNQAALNTLVADLNGNLPFRLAITSEASTASGTWAGVAFGSTTDFPNPIAPGFDGPQLSFNVLEQVPLPAWLDPASHAAWNPSTHVLNVTGAASLIADPGSDVPTIQVSGPTSQLTINAAADSNITIPSLSVSNNGTVTVAAAADPLHPVVTTVSSLSVTGGSIDLTNNELIDTATQANIQGLLSGGSLKTTSIGALGYKDLGGGQTEVRFTLPGDATLDGKVDTSDFVALAGNFNKSGKFWGDGDIDNNGTVNALDFNALASNFGKTIGGGFSSPSLGAVASDAPFSTSVVGGGSAGSSVVGSYSTSSGGLFKDGASLASDVLA